MFGFMVFTYGWTIQKEIFSQISFQYAPSVEELRTTKPAAYAFHLLGNFSLWAPGVLNRTDWNASSPTYGKWVPPPEWRDFCIESSGSPISACSYFMAEEYPGFMAFFHAAMYLNFISLVALRTYLFIGVLHVFKSWAGSAKEYGYESIFTPWGCERNPSCTQVRFLRIWAASTPSWIPEIIIICAYISGLFSPGIGLANSFSTGRLYYGADWNKTPMPPLNSLPPWTWWVAETFSGSPLATPDWDPFLTKYFAWFMTTATQIFTALSTHHISTCILSEPLYEVVLFWTKKVFLFFLMHYQSDPRREEVVRDIFAEHPGSKQYPSSRLFGYPAHGSFRSCFSSFSSTSYWRKGVWAEPLLAGKARIIRIFLVRPFGYGVVTFGSMLALPQISRSGEEGIAKWLHWTHVAQLGMVILELPFTLFAFRCSIFQEMIKDVSLGKHLTSATVYASRMARVKDFQFQSTALIAIIILAYTVLMPYGVAMQAYGIPRRSMWPSPLNFIFNRDGEAMNLLGAPLHALMVKWILTYAYVKWVVAYPEKRESKPKRATLKA